MTKQKGKGKQAKGTVEQGPPRLTVKIMETIPGQFVCAGQIGNWNFSSEPYSSRRDAVRGAVRFFVQRFFHDAKISHYGSDGKKLGKLAPLALLLGLCLGHASVAQTDLDRQIGACASLSACAINVPYSVNPYVVSKPWNLRDKQSLELHAPIGTKIIFYFDTDPAPAVCIDTTGTANLVIDGPIFALGNSSKRPQVLWLHGRGADNRSQDHFAVSNASFLGWYAKASVAMLAVENDEWHSVKFSNGVPNTPALFLSRDNELGLSSQFGPLRVDPGRLTATNHHFTNCAFAHDGHTAVTPPANNDQAFGLTLGTGVHDLHIEGGSTSQGARGGVLRILGPGNRRISISAVNWESEAAKASITIDGFVYGLSVDAGLLMAAGPAVQLNGTAEGLSIRPAEMLTTGVLQVGSAGKLAGAGLVANGLSGQ